jgi:hypothetical protein
MIDPSSFLGYYFRTDHGEQILYECPLCFAYVSSPQGHARFHEPPTEVSGAIRDAGGGVFTVVVDRNTESYPALGSTGRWVPDR